MVPVHRKLNTGDILITTSAVPMIQHFGVVVIEGSTTCIYHSTPEKGASMDTLSNFMEGRQLIDIRKTTATASQIYENWKKVKARKYDYFSFNCIHFAESLTGK
jgi:hypothetical protein